MIRVSTDPSLKSSFELAMERLKKKDTDEGVERRPLTDAQKAAIADVRSYYQALLAKDDVMHQSKAHAIVDPVEREEADRLFRRERERLTGERDAKIEKIRRGEASEG
jgi:hypothetical protein